MRLSAAVLVLVLQLPLVASAATEAPEQTITVIPSDTEQRVEPVTGADEQRVEVLDPNAPDQVTPQSNPGPVGRGLAIVAKVAVGVLAAGVSLGFMAASLLLF